MRGQSMCEIMPKSVSFFRVHSKIYMKLVDTTNNI